MEATANSAKNEANNLPNNVANDVASKENKALKPEDNPVLQGNFAPVEGEQSIASLEVSGQIPADLNGQLLRNGPNPIAPGDNHHWFMGDGMLHGIQIENGNAHSYKNRWVRTENVEQLKGLKAAPISPKQPMIQASGNVSVIKHANKILALPEVGLPYHMDKHLNTIGQYDFSDKLASNMTAHPKVDGKTGELIFFGYEFFAPYLRYHVANPEGEIIHSADIDMPAATMMHDFGVSATRVVFMDLPVVFDLNCVAESGMPFKWSSEHQARLGVMPRLGKSEDIQWINIDPCYVYHPLNTYDDGDNIIMDVVRHNNSFVGGEVFSADISELVRWTINPVAGTVESKVLSDIAQEFPVINPSVECHPHRFGYGLCLKPTTGGMSFSGLLKHDLEKGTTEHHEVCEGREAGEGIFVARSGATDEDDGYVLSVVYDSKKETSDIIIIDAQNFSSEPLATIHLPVRVPFGFHGCFVSEH